MKGSKRVEFKVSLVLPPEATVANTRDYIEDAVASFKGILRPPWAEGGDPLFELDGNTVKVTAIRKPKWERLNERNFRPRRPDPIRRD